MGCQLGLEPRDWFLKIYDISLNLEGGPPQTE
jgi:hypothetical protein